MTTQRKLVKKKEPWIKKNLKYITIALIVLLLFSKMQSCSRNLSHKAEVKELIIEKDSIKNTLSFANQELLTQVNDQYMVIKELQYELKIAGVRAEEAQKRANAVLTTAEKIKTNTTIEIKGAEKDTTNINN